MITRRHCISAAILVLAFALRLAWLDLKPAHFDEGVNGWFVDRITDDGFYHYDPTNFHGPLHFYVLFLAQTLFGRSISVLRMPIVLLSTACVGLVLAFRRYFGEGVCQLAALAMAISPGMVFYGRYAIHETWQLFFLLLTSWGLIGLWRWGQRQYLWAAALGLTGLVLTKETYAIHFATFLLAVPSLLLFEIYEKRVTNLWLRFLGLAVAIGGGYFLSQTPHATRGIIVLLGFCAYVLWREKAVIPIVARISDCKTTSRERLAIGSACVALIFFFYTGGLLDWSALPGLWETFRTWYHTGTDQKSGHEKEWYYWLQLLGRYEWPAAVGLVCGLGMLWPRTSRAMRYLAIYGIGALIAYSIVPYKTPWCIISLMWPFYFIFGYAVVGAARWTDRWAVGTITPMLYLASFGTSWVLNYRDYGDEAEPYVYVQTTLEVNQLLVPLQTLARRDPVNYQIRGHIILGEQYPFSWLLADFPQIDYLDAEQLPDPLDADFLLVDNDHVEKVEPLLRLEYYKLPMHIRGNSADSATLYLYPPTFAGFVPADTKKFEPGSAKAK